MNRNYFFLISILLTISIILNNKASTAQSNEQIQIYIIVEDEGGEKLDEAEVSLISRDYLNLYKRTKNGEYTPPPSDKLIIGETIRIEVYKLGYEKKTITEKIGNTREDRVFKIKLSKTQKEYLTILGRIISENGKEAIGANIKMQGAIEDYSVLSDSTGLFRINISKEELIRKYEIKIYISHPGFQNKDFEKKDIEGLKIINCGDILLKKKDNKLTIDPSLDPQNCTLIDYIPIAGQFKRSEKLKAWIFGGLSLTSSAYTIYSFERVNYYNSQAEKTESTITRDDYLELADKYKTHRTIGIIMLSSTLAVSLIDNVVSCSNNKVVLLNNKNLSISFKPSIQPKLFVIF